MSFLDIKDPTKRDQVVAEFLATKKRLQKRDEEQKTQELTKIQEFQETFQPIIEATKETTEAIKELKVEKPNKITEPFEYFSTHQDVDKYYRIQKHRDKLILGNTEIFLEGDDIKIGNKSFKLTPGLWELLMLNSPKNYDEEDLEVYKEINDLVDLVGHPREIVSGRPKSTKKYRFLKKATGEGVFPWDIKTVRRPMGEGVFLPGDIKGLKTKLYILLAEYTAGNRTTHNQIIAIIDELLRRKQISKKDYQEINTHVGHSP